MPAIVEAVPIGSATSSWAPPARRPSSAASGEAYRAALEAQVAALGMTEQVKFVDRFVGRVELGTWLEAADVFVTPYPGPRPDRLGHPRLRHGRRQGDRLDSLRLRVRDARRRTRQARLAGLGRRRSPKRSPSC